MPMPFGISTSFVDVSEISGRDKVRYYLVCEFGILCV